MEPLYSDFVQHKDSEIVIIKPSEEVVESLESHQLELQSIIGMGKFVDYFRDRVMGWQQSLGLVEEVIKEWVHVSKQWASLESIFLASADIRSQLPDDTKRFEGVYAPLALPNFTGLPPPVISSLSIYIYRFLSLLYSLSLPTLSLSLHGTHSAPHSLLCYPLCRY